SVALRADIEGEPQFDSRPYWRMAVLDEYYGAGFRESRSAAESKRLLRLSELPLDTQLHSQDGSTWTLYLEGGISRYLPMPGSSDMIRFQGEQDLNASLATRTLTTPEVPGSVFSYQLDNVRMERAVAATQL